MENKEYQRPIEVINQEYAEAVVTLEAAKKLVLDLQDERYQLYYSRVVLRHQIIDGTS